MFDNQALFWVGEFDSEKECAAGNEVSAITRHRIFACGLSVGEGMVCFFKILTLLKLTFSDDIRGRLKALASTQQPRACVPHTPYALILKFRVIHR